MGRRRWGEGTVYQRQDKRWVMSLRMADGRHRTSYHRSRAAAEEALERARSDRAAGLGGPDVTLGAYLRAWMGDVAPILAPSTLRQHRNIIENHLIPALGSIRLSRLSVPQVRAYLHSRDLHPQTVSHHRATLRRALNDAVRDGYVARNVAALARPPAVRREERAWLTADQVRGLLDATEGHRLQALWALGATAGLRMAEALALSWDDIDMQAATVTVRHTLHRMPGRRLPGGTREPGSWGLRAPKTRGSRRVVPLTRLALRTLHAHELRQAEEQLAHGTRRRGLVFATPDGRPMHGTNVLPDLYAALAAAGLPRVTFHGLRHSAASVMLEAGIPLRVVSELLGHSTIRITADLYTHVAPALARDAADRLQEVLEARPTVRTTVNREAQ